MFRPVRRSSGTGRRLFLALAVLAIFLKVLIPPGFMAGPRTNDLPFALVLCTGDGSTVVAPGQALPGHGDDTAPASHDAPCLFAGHALGAPPPSAAGTGVAELVAYAYRPAPIQPGLAPGRGLTSPPPPARAPPIQLT